MGPTDNASMKVRKPQRQLRNHYFKEWRKKRGLTQEQAAARLDIDRTTLSKIERIGHAYSQSILEAAAEAYSCEPWDILNVNPLKEGRVVDLTQKLRDADPDTRAQALGYIEGLLAKKQA